MRKLIVTEFVNVDGVVKAPGGEPGHPRSGWVFDYIGEEQIAFKLQKVLEADAHLRHTPHRALSPCSGSRSRRQCQLKYLQKTIMRSRLAAPYYPSDPRATLRSPPLLGPVNHR